MYLKAFDEISKTLDEGELVCIFPEGKLTKDGEIDEFKPGIEKIIQRNPVPVIPIALRGMWGSFFSHRGGNAFSRLPQRFWSKVEIHTGEPVAPADVNADDLKNRVLELRKDFK